MVGRLLKQICCFEEINDRLLDDYGTGELTGNINHDVHCIGELKKYIDYYSHICDNAIRRLEILQKEKESDTTPNTKKAYSIIQEDYDRAIKKELE